MTKYCERKLNNITNKRRSVLSYALSMEKNLEKYCKKVWEFTNRNDEKFIFALYIDPINISDTTIVTIATEMKYARGYTSLLLN